MILNYNLIFKYLLWNNKTLFLKSNNYQNDFFTIFLKKQFLYFAALHVKMSTPFYSTQLIDIFAYETARNTNKKNNLNLKYINNNVVYNFQNCFNQQRFFFFLNTQQNEKKSYFLKNNKNLKSITELFLNANWLEREVAELSGIFFIGKKDIRNLMLQYGDSSAPFRKSYPSVGLRELYYDVINDSLTHSPVSIQF